MFIDNISNFSGEYSFLSNFYPVDIEYEGLIYPSVEHYYQAAKCKNAEDKLLFTDVNLTPGQAKRLGGRKISIRNGWENVKIDVMYEGIKLKFKDYSLLAQKLIETGDLYLEEGNYWGDTFWGVDNKKSGRNVLGHLLMARRNILNAV